MDDGMTLRQQVAARATCQCEYCCMPERWASLPLQVDHIIAEKHNGETSLDNLAYACVHCNAFKGPNIAGRDPATKNIERLFNPRQDDWEEHFRWDGPTLEARTAIGRVTLAVLRINLPYRVAVRASLMEEGQFSP